MTIASPLTSKIAICTEDVCRHYAMGDSLIRAVDGISISIPSAEFVALLGTSGSGKSSLLNLIAGLDRPTSGAVLVEGSNLAALSREALARHRLRTVGMVFQSFNLIPSMTVMENVELPLRFAEVDRGKRGSQAREALDRVGLSRRLGHRPSELSGGEQQRTALARALINRPRLLLADEPTGNLDEDTADGVLALARDLVARTGCGFLMVTHSARLAATLDRQVTLHTGRVT